MQGTIDECISQLFAKSNTVLADELGIKYNTIAGWRYQHGIGKLSTEKKRTILEKSGYKLQKQEIWRTLRRGS